MLYRKAGVAVGLAACVAGGCAVERVTAVDLAGGAGAEGGSARPGDAGAAVGDGPIDAGADATGPTPVSPSCTDAAFNTESNNNGWNDDAGDGYLVRNNVWNQEAGPGLQILYGCTYQSWYVVSTQDAGVVVSYPNVQMNFALADGGEVPIAAFTRITSSFREQSPHVGAYEDAYDIWLNGVGDPGATQILVWVDTWHRAPEGTMVATHTFGTTSYDVWMTADGLHFVLEATSPFSTGTVDLLEIIQWVNGTWLGPDVTLGQIDFGVEIESTDGASATFAFDSFSIDAQR